MSWVASPGLNSVNRYGHPKRFQFPSCWWVRRVMFIRDLTVWLPEVCTFFVDSSLRPFFYSNYYTSWTLTLIYALSLFVPYRCDTRRLDGSRPLRSERHRNSLTYLRSGHYLLRSMSSSFRLSLHRWTSGSFYKVTDLGRVTKLTDRR